MANKLYASLNYFDLYFTQQDVDSMPLSGQCDYTVQAIAKKPYIIRQFAAIDNSKLVNELSEYGHGMIQNYKTSKRILSVLFGFLAQILKSVFLAKLC